MFCLPIGVGFTDPVERVPDGLGIYYLDTTNKLDLASYEPTKVKATLEDGQVKVIGRDDEPLAVL